MSDEDKLKLLEAQILYGHAMKEAARMLVERDRLHVELLDQEAKHEHSERHWYLRGDEIERLRAALIAAMDIVHSWRAINAQQDRQVPEIHEFGKKLDAVIEQADAALGSER